MFKQVFRVAFLTLVWKQYKQLIISTGLLFGYLFLISSIHGDYLIHAELQNESSNVGVSFIYKWLAFLIGVISYFAYHTIRSSKRANSDKQKHRLQESSDNGAVVNSADDPFSEIRERDTLRGRADFLIDETDK